MRASRAAPWNSLWLAPLLFAAAGGAPAEAVHSPVAENPQSSVRMISPWAVAPADGELWLGLHFTTLPGWHVYWKNSGDAGYPPEVRFDATPEIVEAELLWPAPKRYELPGGLVAFGYEGEVVYPIHARLDADAAQGAVARGAVTVVAEVDYLVCEIECVPYGYRLVLEQPLAQPGGPATELDPTTAPLLDAYRRRLPQTAEALGLTTDAELLAGAGGQLIVRVASAGDEAARPPVAAGRSGVDVFFEPHPQLDLGAPVAERADGTLVLRVPVSYFDAGNVPSGETELAWTVTGLATGDGPASFEARRRIPVRSGAAAAGSEPAAPAGERSPLAALGPALGVLLALAAALLCWGLGRRSPAAAAVDRSAGGLAGLLGFCALAVGVLLLYRLSRVASSTTVAFVELSLLGVALAVWAAGAARRRPVLRAAFAVAAVGLAALVLWLAANA